MAHSAKTIQIPAQHEAFCVVTGPHDSCIQYESGVSPIVPVLVDSPVVLHLCCPELFPDEVLKVHAEHLGHFLALQSVPKIDEELEGVLYKGLCATFTEQEVLGVYASCIGNAVAIQNGSAPNVFANVNRTGVKGALALIRGLLALFDKDALRGYITYTRDEEPLHVLFLSLAQLFVVFLSSAMTEQDLGTVVAVASAVFLESNHCHPLCASTILKPMFVPYFEQQQMYAKGKPQLERREQKVLCYKLFRGYDVDTDGAYVRTDDDDISWTEYGLANRMQDRALLERGTRALWFAAPQYGDRLSMIYENGCWTKVMGGQSDERAKKIAAMLVSDTVLGYVQCAVFGTIRNMLPCHDNSDLTVEVMTQLGGSMNQFAVKALRHQSLTLWNGVRKLTNGCLSVTGTGFMGQDKGSSLLFGRVYTGTDDKKPSSKCAYGTFTSVALALAGTTMTSASLNVALGQRDKSPRGARDNLHSVLSTPYRASSTDAIRTVSDMTLYARYNHRLNSGEFTEVANVKSINDTKYNSQVHVDNLTSESKYQMTVSHGALPMCPLTTAMTVRQTVIMLTGYMCAELARVTYGHKVLKNDTLCKYLTGLILHGKFRNVTESKSADNTMKARFGELLKMSGPVFSASQQQYAQNLNSMEWLNPNDPRLPECVRTSLAMIGDTRRAVEKIMRDSKKSYNRLVLQTGSNDTLLRMSTMYANGKYMVHAPLLTSVNLTLFNNNSINSLSRAMCKLSKRGSFYVVRVFPNRCIDLSYMAKYCDDAFVSGSKSTTSNVTQVFDRIKEEVSCVLPRIDAKRIKMLALDMSQEDVLKLVEMVQGANIEISGDLDQIDSAEAGVDTNKSAPADAASATCKRPRASGDDEEPPQKQLCDRVYDDASLGGLFSGGDQQSDCYDRESPSIFDAVEYEEDDGF